jgi:tRNA-binding protein
MAIMAAPEATTIASSDARPASNRIRTFLPPVRESGGGHSFHDGGVRPPAAHPRTRIIDIMESARTAGTIEWKDFEAVELRVGTIVEVSDFPEAKKPAYRLTVDFGPTIGTLRSSARITELYGKADLVGRQVVGVVNFPAKRIGPFLSECLVTGFYREDGAVVLAIPERTVPNGAKLG